MTETETETDADVDGGQFPDGIPWRRVANVVGLLLLIAIVLPFFVYAVPQVVGADQSYVVLSGSMEPTMNPGDAIIVDSVPASEIEEGDVITYGPESDTTTHRVIEVTEQNGEPAFRTQGDNNDTPDAGSVTPDELQGKLMSIGGFALIIPYIGHVILFASTPTGLVLLFLIPVGLLVANEIWNVVTSATPAEDTGDAVAGAGADAGDTPEGGAVTDSGSSTVESESTATATDGDSGLTFSAFELQLGLVMLGAFLVYSIWVAYAAIEVFQEGVVWATGVAGSVGVAFLLFLAFYLSGRGSSGAGQEASDAEDRAESATEAATDASERADGTDTGHDDPPGTLTVSEIIEGEQEFGTEETLVSRTSEDTDAGQPVAKSASDRNGDSDTGQPSAGTDRTVSESDGGRTDPIGGENDA